MAPRVLAARGCRVDAQMAPHDLVLRVYHVGDADGATRIVCQRTDRTGFFPLQDSNLLKIQDMYLLNISGNVTIRFIIHLSHLLAILLLL